MSAEDKPVDDRWTLIEANAGWSFRDLQELYQFRDMLYFLAWRDVKVRYKQTILGGMWVILQPLVTMVVFTLFFGKLAGLPSDGVPHELFYFAALIPWGYFSSALNSASMSLVSNTYMIQKLYFPRMVLPLASILGKFLDFMIAFGALLLMLALYLHAPTASIAFLPLLVVIMLTTIVGGSLFLSALIIKFRDFQFTLSFGIQFLMFASPVIYPASVVPEPFRLFYALNPMVGVIEGFRASLLGTTAFPTGMVAISAGVSLVLLIAGLFYFKQVENYFADIA